MKKKNYCSTASKVGACETAFGSSVVTAAVLFNLYLTIKIMNYEKY